MTRLLMEEASEDEDLLDALSRNASMDHMGTESIVYWPHIRCEETDSGREDDDEEAEA